MGVEGPVGSELALWMGGLMECEGRGWRGWPCFPRPNQSPPCHLKGDARTSQAGARPFALFASLRFWETSFFFRSGRPVEYIVIRRYLPFVHGLVHGQQQVWHRCFPQILPSPYCLLCYLSASLADILFRPNVSQGPLGINQSWRGVWLGTRNRGCAGAARILPAQQAPVCSLSGSNFDWG